MNISDEIAKLQGLRERGALTEDEFAQAKARVLSGEPKGTDTNVQAQLDKLRAEGELARLDREWDQEKQSLMMRGRYGRKYVPTRGGSLAMGVFAIVFGLFWTFMTSSNGAPGIFQLFGAVFVIVGVVGSVQNYARANDYENAEADYQNRRSELMNQGTYGKDEP